MKKGDILRLTKGRFYQNKNDSHFINNAPLIVLKGKKMNKEFLQALATLQDNINTVIKKEDNP